MLTDDWGTPAATAIQPMREALTGAVKVVVFWRRTVTMRRLV